MAEHTVDRAATALRSHNVACLPEVVRLLRALSGDGVEVSVAELGEIIQQDATIVAKVLNAANTLGYNPGAVGIGSVTQAIHVIGYERIRMLAMSLILVEQTVRTRSPDEQREAAALALAAGSLARSLAAQRQLPDPEHAFVCASLRHFGRIVMTTFMVEEYQKARTLTESEEPYTDDEAFRCIFGLTPLELGYELLRSSNLPEAILKVLHELPPEVLASLRPDPEAQLLAIADFSAKLAELALSSKISPTDFPKRSQELARQYRTVLPGLADGIPALIAEADAHIASYVKTFSIRSLPPASLDRFRQRAAPPTTAEQTVKRVVAAPAPPRRTEIGNDWPAAIAELVAMARTRSRHEVFSAAIDVVQRGLGCPECLLFQQGPTGAEYLLTYGEGRSFAPLRDRAIMRPEERTVFGVCLSRHENVFIHNANDPKIAPYLPAWFREAGIGAFALLPLPGSEGLLLAGWMNPRQVMISTEDARHICELLMVPNQAAERLRF